MSLDAEWLEADGLGGFASGTVSGIRMRRYHALLLVARTPPTDRVVLVNGFDATIDTAAGSFALSSQAYVPEVLHPDGARRIESFSAEPWPRWIFRLPDGTQIVQEIFVPHGAAVATVRWRATTGRSRVRPPAILRVRPFLSGRDYHSLHHENPGFRFEPEEREGGLVWRSYPGVPAVFVHSNGSYSHEPQWYRDFRYDAERARGLDFSEDLASPGEFRFDLAAGAAVWLLAAEGHEQQLGRPNPLLTHDRLSAAERKRRRAFPAPVDRAADAYVVRRGEGRTLVAGYPWFTDWGRDTFVAMRGLCLATGRLAVTRDILVLWANAISDGMLPNRFPDHGRSPEFNSVDASLWYVIAVHDFLVEAERSGAPAAAEDRAKLVGAVAAIVEAYEKGTRLGIQSGEDGLLAAGEPGAPLTWMDAKVGDRVVTPRIGKPVEVQALWVNALRIAAELGVRRWEKLATRAADAFRARFWNEDRGYLYDVIDVDHRHAVDASFRPNQILAVGGLPFALLDGAPARRLVDEVERLLWTPLGLRSLAPGEPGYSAHYEGGVAERDGAYHQGTAWPWLAGPFVEAWVRVRGSTRAARREARKRFLGPLLAHLAEAGLGHVSEIADAEAPHSPRGCPFQAWSLGELLRLDRSVLHAGRSAKRRSPRNA